jgi:hypothetical protein
MSTKNLLARAATKPSSHTAVPEVETAPGRAKAAARIKKTITLDAQTVKALHKLRAHISIEEETQTDFGRIIDEAVVQLLHSKGLTL